MLGMKKYALIIGRFPNAPEAAAFAELGGGYIPVSTGTSADLLTIAGKN